ncbi:PREDICTED: androgen-dependent TFPI-regulating protein-like [Papilio polytes]|uniref:androgen-dependent TFPI-regulating protein-like n=1 Tax=Papilio polytes TaxID=76194 RepID=UPI0006763188|nr:PREDICTED: androgen-dependent TFPI-regulating protein-like [Papilio polytes]
MFNLQNVFLKHSRLFLKTRLFMYCLTYAHLNIMSVVLLNKDFSTSNDPDLKVYLTLKWKLITTWFNILTIPYIPICVYCDWRELKRKVDRPVPPNVEKLKNIRDFYFTNLILPATLYADVLFWNLWNTDRKLLMPLSVDKYVSVWEQHSMHTASLVFVIFDLVLVPRQRPKTYKWGIILLSIYLTSYIFVCLTSLLKGEYVYPGLKSFTTFKFFVLTIHMFIGHLFYYTGQWFVIDILWGQSKSVKEIA